MFSAVQVDNLLREVKAKISYRLPPGVSFDDVAEANRQQIVDVMVERTSFALEQAILGALSTLKTQAEEYINGLKISENLEIEIDDKVKYLEEGYGRWEMLEHLVTGPKAKVSKEGNLYNRIPIGKRRGKRLKDAIEDQTLPIIREGAAVGGSLGSLKTVVDKMMSNIRGTSDVPASDVSKFATASTKQDSGESWVHPGFTGVNQLDGINYQLKSDLVETVANIIETEAFRR